MGRSLITIVLSHVLVTGTAALPPSAPCSKPVTAWAQGGDGFTRPASHVTTDATGNIYYAGDIPVAIADLDPTHGTDMHEPVGDGDAYVTKLKADGTYAWSRTAGGYDPGPFFPDRAASRGVAVTSAGTVVVAGTFGGVVDFDPRIGTDERSAVGDFNGFLWALSDDGTYLWTVTFGAAIASGQTTASPAKLVLDQDENILATGTWWGDLDFDPGPEVDQHRSPKDADIFVTKFYSDGAYAWTRTVGGYGFDLGTGVAADPDGNVFVTGTFRGSVDFDPSDGVDVHVAVGVVEDVFVTKLSPDGEYRWTRTWPVKYQSGRGNVAVDAKGSVYVTGVFRETIDFDPTDGVDFRTANVDETGRGEGDIFLTKVNGDGSYGWTYTAGGSGQDISRSVAVHPEVGVVIGGGFRGEVDFDPGPGVDAPSGSAFVTALGFDGSYRWTRAFESSGAPLVEHVAIDPAGAMIVYGRFLVDMDLDPGCGVDPLTTGEFSSGRFIAKLACIEPTADADGNGAVDLRDYAAFANCFSGPAPTVCHNGCETFDFTRTDDIHLSDFAAFHALLTGPE